MAKGPACPKCRYRLNQSDTTASVCPKCSADVAHLASRIAQPPKADGTAEGLDRSSAAAVAEAPASALVDGGPSYVDQLAVFLHFPPFLRQRRTLILLAWGLMSLLVTLSIFTSSDLALPTQDPITAAIESYGRSISASAKEGVLVYQSTQQTHADPRRAYKVVYVTDDKALKSEPVTSKGSPGWDENRGLALVWKMKFCSRGLIATMMTHGVIVVEGRVVDATTGEIHQLAVCNQPTAMTVRPRPHAGSASAAPLDIGEPASQ